jgi:hypothetical protein
MVARGVHAQRSGHDAGGGSFHDRLQRRRRILQAPGLLRRRYFRHELELAPVVTGEATAGACLPPARLDGR